MYRSYRKKNNNWITNGMRISCKCKRNLYVLSRNNDDPQVNDYYKRYCATLRKIIRETKKLHYYTQTKNSANKVKTIRDIIKNNTGQSQILERISELSSDNGNIKDAKEIANTFNKFFCQLQRT
jgi:hypothetical protein